MTTEEWRQLPAWVKIAIMDAGFHARQVAEVRHVEPKVGAPAKIDVRIRPTMPKDIEFTVVVDPAEGA